jgi:hypothetical protein
MFNKYIIDPSQGFWQPSYHLHILLLPKSLIFFGTTLFT